MTFRQQRNLQIVRENVKEIRLLLDDVMYHMDPLTEEEHKKIRECYDLICKANDKI
jgi:hypothetical protein